MSKTDVLRNLSFGDSVAEAEADNLRRYFVTTDQWDKVFSGAADIVYGPKGSGKSAIYSLLQQESQELANRHITFITAENPRGATAFQDLVTEPPASEQAFMRLWKLYILSLVGEYLDKNIKNSDAVFVAAQLRESGLLARPDSTLSEKFAAVFAYVKR